MVSESSPVGPFDMVIYFVLVVSVKYVFTEFNHLLITVGDGLIIHSDKEVLARLSLGIILLHEVMFHT
jgi:hypothetical protein